MSPMVKRSLVGGLVSALVLGTGTYILGAISGYEARDLLLTSLSSINALCTTVIIGSSTILALMLTLISLSRAAKSKLTSKHYQHVLVIAQTDTVLIIITVITFLLLNLPITESDNVPASWYITIYYVSLGMAAVLGGGFIAVVSMLYGTIANVIEIVGFKRTDHPLVDHGENSGNQSPPKKTTKRDKDRRPVDGDETK